MRRTFLAVVLAIMATGAASPSLGIDWPVPGTPTLEIASGGGKASFPAPPWIESASYDETRPDDTNVTAKWRVHAGGFDLVGEQLVAMITDSEHWNLGVIGYLSDDFFDSCDLPIDKSLDPAPGSPTLFLTYALCGYDYGSSSGGMLIGLSRDVGTELLFDLWYHVPLKPFDTSDEAAWPMSAADLEATVHALDAAVSVEVASE